MFVSSQLMSWYCWQVSTEMLYLVDQIDIICYYKHFQKLWVSDNMYFQNSRLSCSFSSPKFSQLLSSPRYFSQTRSTTFNLLQCSASTKFHCISFWLGNLCTQYSIGVIRWIPAKDFQHFSSKFFHIWLHRLYPLSSIVSETHHLWSACTAPSQVVSLSATFHFKVRLHQCRFTNLGYFLT